MTTSDLKQLTLAVSGMHCPNCDVLIERRFKTLPGVRRVRADYRTGMVQIDHTGDLALPALQAALEDEDYRVSAWTGSAVSGGNTRRDYVEIAAIFLILAAPIFTLRQFDLLPRGFGVSTDMSYGLVLLIGLVASVSSCIAVTGGLLVAVAAKYNEATGARPGLQRLKPLIYFNAGRILSYTLLGGVVGALGSALTLSANANGILTLIASAIMIVLGLQMLKLFPALGRLIPTMPKLFGHKIHDLAARETKGGAFLLGASTFFLPCGFTQALQLYVLAKGSFTTGALTMLAFAIGTLPALLSLSAVSSFARGVFQKYFLRVAGAAVIVLGIVNIQYGFVLTGSGFAVADAADKPADVATPSEMIGSKQVIYMHVSGFDYLPHRFVVKEGVPVEWRIDGSDAAGCGRMLYAPRLGIRSILSSNATTVIAFTPPAPGEYAFNCGMGMMTPGSSITVVPNTNG